MARCFFRLVDQAEVYHDGEGIERPDDEAALTLTSRRWGATRVRWCCPEPALEFQLATRCEAQQ